MVSAKVHVVARIPVRAEAADIVATGFRKLAAATREEPGCISYRLFRNRDNPFEFTTVEEWADAAAESAHMVAPHVNEFLDVLKPALSGAPDVQRYTELD